jgi:hypothetical protein
MVQPAETDAPIEEDLRTACNLRGGVEEFLDGSTSGEVCQLAASVIGRGNRRTYSFELSKHHVDLSFQVVLTPLEGSPIMCVPRTCHHRFSSVLMPCCAAFSTYFVKPAVTRCRSLEHQRSAEEWSEEKFETWQSGNDFIFLATELKPGTNRVVLESTAIVSTFSLRIEFFRGDITISEASVVVLELIKQACCPDGCDGVLDDVGTERQLNICQSAGNHCDGEGHLTHLDLSTSNMKCDLATVDTPLFGLKKLQVLPAALHPSSQAKLVFAHTVGNCLRARMVRPRHRCHTFRNAAKLSRPAAVLLTVHQRGLVWQRAACSLPFPQLL